MARWLVHSMKRDHTNRNENPPLPWGQTLEPTENLPRCLQHLVVKSPVLVPLNQVCPLDESVDMHRWNLLGINCFKNILRDLNLYFGPGTAARVQVSIGETE